MIDRERLVQTFCELVKIDSPSGEEQAIAAELTLRLRRLGLNVTRDGHGNLIASEDAQAQIILSAHMDTVEPGRGIRPRVEGDRIVSDGSTVLGGDCKAGVAAILETLESIKEEGTLHLPIEVVFTRQEELALMGARNLDFSIIQAKEALVFDSEGPPSRIVSSSPTYIGLDIEIVGRSAHAGVEPEKGLSAIRIAAELISDLPQGRLDDESTFNIGTIQGGTVRNAVPETAVIRGELRSVNPETADRLQLQVREAVDQVRRTFPDATVADHFRTEFHAYTLTDDDPATRRVTNAMRSLGMQPEMKPSGAGTDGNVFRRRGISAVVVGMADHNMHTVREYVTIPDLVDAARLCEAMVRAGA